MILYFVLLSVYSDGEHEKEIEKMEQMLRENTNEENEWKEDLKEVMEHMEEEEGEEDESKASSSATTTYARGRNEDEKPVEMNKCFPVLQHNRDASWGRYADFDFDSSKNDKEDDQKEKENKEVQLFRKVLEKVSGKEPEECVDTSASTKTSFLKGSWLWFFQPGTYPSVALMQIEAHDWVIRLNGHNAPKSLVETRKIWDRERT